MLHPIRAVIGGPHWHSITMEVIIMSGKDRITMPDIICNLFVGGFS